MKYLANIFDIDFHLPWDDDTLIEERHEYKYLVELVKPIAPKIDWVVTYDAFYCALGLFAVQFINGEQHSMAVRMEGIDDRILNKIEDLQLKELAWFSSYFGLIPGLKLVEGPKEYFTTSRNEILDNDTVCEIIAFAITRKIEFALEQIRFYLKYNVKAEQWYKLYEVESDYDKEKVEAWVSSIIG